MQPRGSQYFRKPFNGVANMAAYEIQLKFIAYINGKEVFREHMPAPEFGVITPSTPSSGSFATPAFHGVIRPASEVSATTALLFLNGCTSLPERLHFSSLTAALLFLSGCTSLPERLHFSTPLSTHAITFDAYVAVVVSSTPSAEGEPCFIYPYAVSIASPKGDTPAALFDFNKESVLEASLEDFPITVTLQPSGPHLFLNSLRMWPSSEPAASVGAFSLEGRSGSSAFAPILSRANLQYEVNTYRRFPSYFHADAYQTSRLHLTSVAGAPYFLLVEMQPMTCNTQMPTTIQFSPSSYSVYALYDQVHIAPVLKEITGCSVSPALPAGLSLDETTCTVSGILHSALPNTTFVMTSTMGGMTLQGSFSLEGVVCEGTLLTVTRTYSWRAFQESFSIKDKATQEEVLSVAANSGQVSSETWSTMLCLTGSLYEVDVGSTSVYWQGTSFLYLYAILDGEEVDTVARIRYDANLGLPEDHIVNLKWSVAPKASWFYKMGELPASWHNAETAEWESGSFGSFSASSNQIQLYKKSFNVASLEGVAGFVISLRYIYGCVMYMNGVEVFRNGMDGDLSLTSLGLNNYNDVLYHQISLPVRTVASVDNAAVDSLRTGDNTIAIAILAQTATQTASVFDCAVRLMSGPSSSRVFSYTISSYNNQGSAVYVAEHYYGYTMNAYYWTLVFANDRREWISSTTLYLYYTQDTQQPREFLLRARNNNLEEWTTLKTVTDMAWSLKGEHKKLWVENSKLYNHSIDLSADAIGVVPELSYPTPLVLSAGVEMGEVYPNSEFYYDFTVTPALPEGLSIDTNTGKISGRVASLLPSATYSIQARKVSGGVSTAVVTLSVEACMGGKSLITLVAFTDSWPSEGSYKLHKGKAVSGEVVSSVSAFKVPNGLNYGDFCVAHGLYALELLDSRKDGWKNPAGWWLTVDLGEMIFDMGQMPSKVDRVSTVFSSLLPFQVEVDEWKLFNSENAVSEDYGAGAMGNHVGTTAYIRREVSIPSLEDYHVLNVRVKYVGGIAAYFNGRLVARFNLAEGFDASTEAQTVHDSSFSKFHVILPMVVHRAPGQSAIVFDATGVFGVNDCSVAVGSFSSIDASPVTGCAKEGLLELKTPSFGSLPNEVGSFLAWRVENQEGSKWNRFGIHTNNAAYQFGYSLYGRRAKGAVLPVLAVTNASTKERARNLWEAPVAVMGFPSFRFEVDAVASTDVSVNAFMTLYCKPASTGSCPAVGDFPAVGEGQISPAACPEGFQGYAYRECANGVLGDVKNEKCEYLLPEAIQYESSNMEFVLNTEVSSGKPAYKNIITEFFMQSSTPLPEGLSIDATTGKSVREMEQRAFTVRGKNPAGETIVEVTMAVRKGYCQPEGVFERTNVGEVAVYERERVCWDGEWQKATGNCLPIMGIVIAVVIVILVIVAVVFILLRTRKSKSVGGVKGKAAKKTQAKKTTKVVR
ncbi:hypothetical protein WA577_001813, partial [Blastocystis sp. JDR]